MHLIYFPNFDEIFQQVKSDVAHEKETDLHVVSYERTPVMSTYLLAFVVGEYDFVEAKVKRNICIPHCTL